MWPDDIKPHPLNVPGDFYVEDNCCTACGVPQSVAPTLFPIMDASFEHCYVSKQPSSKAELEQMLTAMQNAELACIRYRGVNAEIRARIRALPGDGSIDLCDELPGDEPLVP
jgi:hypothetical protein